MSKKGRGTKMSTITICDVCGKETSGKAPCCFLDSQRHYYDLCDECAEKVRRILSAKVNFVKTKKEEL